MKNAAYIHPWRNWITQQIPILENGGSNPFGWAKKIKDTIVVVSQLVEKVQHLLGFLLFLWYNKSGDENVGKES